MKKFIIYLVTIALTVLFILHSFYRASEVGLVLRETHPWLEIAYYVVLIIVIYFLILRPLVIILFSPFYSINRFIDDVQNNDTGIRKRAITLIKNKTLDKTDEEVLMNALNHKDKKVLSRRKFEDKVIRSINEGKRLSAEIAKQKEDANSGNTIIHER